MSAKKVIRAIRKYTRFLLTSHIGLEGDALGSELALASLLRKLGKQVWLVNSDRAPANYGFLPGIKKIRHNLKKCDFQVAIIVDCPDKKRIGRIAQLIDQGTPIINIDHHTGNKEFGQVNWVNPHASSAGEMIYQLFKLKKVKLDKEDAFNIYTAIVTDTGSFRHFNTASSTHLVASQLLKLGINPAEIYSRIYENNSVEDVYLVNRIVSNLRFAADNKIAWVKINRGLFKKIEARREILDKILDFARSVNTVKIVIVFSEVGRRLIKLSLRSKPPVDVHRVASLFSGGGHKFASGCIIKGSLHEVEQRVLREAKRALVRTINYKQ